MGGGLLQLVAYGAQDAYISGNPHITFWKVLYKRHTNFAMEAFRVNFTGKPSWGQRLVAVVNRNADLMYKTYLEVVLPDTSSIAVPSGSVSWTGDANRRLGYAILKKIEVEIGGQIIDTHYGEWLFLWENLTSNYDNSVKLDAMVGGNIGGSITTNNSCGGRPGVLYIPLQFWFCRNPGLALPLIALQYHEVRLNFYMANATDLVSSTGYSSVSAAAAALPNIQDMSLYIDYIYLDVEERRRFAQQSHEYLIDQLQYGMPQTITSQSTRIDLTLNHPVKELVWVFQDVRKIDCASALTTATGYTQPFSYDDIVSRCRLQINGQDRFSERYGDYFWKVQPYQHHSGGAFEQHALTQQPLIGNSPGTSYITFTATTATGALTLSSVAITGGATWAQIVGIPVQVVTGVNTSTGAITVLPGNTVVFGGTAAVPTATMSGANAIGTGVASTFYAIFEPIPSASEPFTSTTPLAGAGYVPNPSFAGTGASASYIPAIFNYAQAGYQQTNYGYTQSVNPINMYSFSLAPEEHQPSGSCNFSRIDTTTLVFDTLTGNTAGALSAGQFPSKAYPYLFRLYAVNYNIFRVMSGMGGLAYSN